MNPRRLAGDAVGLSWIKLQIKLLAGVNEAVNHLHSVLHVHVVVTRAVDLQPMAVELRGKVHRRTLDVSGVVGGNQTFVAVGGNGYVVAPIRHWAHGNSCDEASGGGRRVERFGPAVAAC